MALLRAIQGHESVVKIYLSNFMSKSLGLTNLEVSFFKSSIANKKGRVWIANVRLVGKHCCSESNNKVDLTWQFTATRTWGPALKGYSPCVKAARPQGRAIVLTPKPISLLCWSPTISASLMVFASFKWSATGLEERNSFLTCNTVFRSHLYAEVGLANSSSYDGTFFKISIVLDVSSGIYTHFWSKRSPGI